MNSPRFLLALTAGKISAVFCKVFFPKRGSNLPGAVALRFDSQFLTRVKGIESSKTIFITGTNGKSTSNNMVVHAFRTAGYSVCSNLEGANMKPGVATALIRNTTMGGSFNKEYLILEVDERSLEAIAKDLKTDHLCITNVQKDQVQRNGDPDYIYQKIKRAVSSLTGTTLYVNNEEPRSKSMGASIREDGRAAMRENVRVVSFGVVKNERSSSIEDDWGVTMPCPVCHDALIFNHLNLANVGYFECPNCGFSSGEQPDMQVSEIDYENHTFTVCGKYPGFENKVFRINYPAAFFLYNYALCACLCAEFGIEAETLKAAFESFTNIAGRLETFSHAGKRVCYTRIKQENPETLQNAIDMMGMDKSTKAFVAGPDTVNDIIPWYSNTFYTFDCNFEPLIESGVEKYICFGTTVSWDMYNRLRYAGVPDDMIEILDTDDEKMILDAIASVKTDNVYLITLLKKYEHLKELAV